MFIATIVILIASLPHSEMEIIIKPFAFRQIAFDTEISLS